MSTTASQVTNGQLNDGYSPEDWAAFTVHLNKMGFVTNDSILRRDTYIEMFSDKQRNIERDCGYPETHTLTADRYKELYDRDPIAYRINNLYAKECWQVCPEIYETEDVNIDTPFEQAFKEIGRCLSSVGYYESNEGNPLWEYLERADIASGIGRYGIILIGTDHSGDLRDPVTLEELEAVAKLTEAAGTPGAKGRTYTTIEYGKPKRPLGRPGTHESEREELLEGDKAGLTPAKPLAKPLAVPEEEAGGTAEADLEEEGVEQPVDPTKEAGEFDDSEDRQSLDEATDDEGEELTYNPSEFVPKHKLLYLRVLDETQAPISKWVNDPKDPRFGLPEEYSVTISGGTYSMDMNGQASSGQISITDSTVTHQVHWTRIIHIADNLLTNESLGTPRTQQSYNRLYDLHKLYGASAEMYYQGAFMGLSFETHPQLGGDVEIDEAKFKSMLHQYRTRLSRHLFAPGLAVKSLAPQVVDPSKQVEVQLDAICVGQECPKRIFLGSERGELASSQDSRAWVGRIKRRQNRYVSPRLVVAVIDRLIRMGILPVPKQFYCEWPDIAGITDLEKADICLKRTQSLAAYVSGGLDAVIELKDYYMREMGYSQEEAEQIIKGRMEHLDREMQGIEDEDLNIHAREDQVAVEEAEKAALDLEAAKTEFGSEPGEPLEEGEELEEEAEEAVEDEEEEPVPAFGKAQGLPKKLKAKPKL